MGTPNTQHPDRQSSQPEMNRNASQSKSTNASDPRQSNRGRDVEEPKKPGDDIEQYASEEEDLDARDVTDEWDDSTDSQFASQRNAGSVERQTRSADSSLSKEQPLQGQQRSSSSSQRETSQREGSSQQRDTSSQRENISSDKTGNRSSSSERSSSDKRH
jgi:hypothetical protein